MRGRTPNLTPLKLAVLQGQAKADAEAEACISRAWHLVVGPALVRHTRLIRIRRRALVMGCWKTELIAPLRKSAEAVWPQLQIRLERLLGIKLHKLEIVPCDPPPPVPRSAPSPDPLDAVLAKLRSQCNLEWTPGRK